MLFQTTTFFGFFVVFFALYALTMRSLRLQNLLIVIGSYVFYGAWDLRFLSLLVVGTGVAYVLSNGAGGERIAGRDVAKGAGLVVLGSLVSLAPGLPGTLNYLTICLLAAPALLLFTSWVNRLEARSRARWCVGATAVFSLGLLGFFKYYNFFVDSLASLLAQFGMVLDLSLANIVLPVGISFFTFQLLGYTIDVYRGDIAPTRSIIKLAAFKAFFPQLVAGPIERAGNLLGQFDKPRHLSWDGIKSGAVLFAWGMYKKVVVADNLAPLVERIFSNPADASAGTLLAGVVAFTFQIYCDFSGYSDMARGLARMMGFELMVNFNLPYIARTPSEFWLRWHISLSSWLRDYVYVPLGGNRRGPTRTYVNLAATMLIGGLWHGASWTFVLWGAFHGFILIVYRMLRVDDWLRKRDRAAPSRAINLASIAVMFVLTMFGWLVFRARDMHTLSTYVSGLLAGGDWTSGPWSAIAMLVAPLLVVQTLQIAYGRLEIHSLMPRPLRLNVALFVVFSIVFLSSQQDAAFIYFDF